MAPKPNKSGIIVDIISFGVYNTYKLHMPLIKSGGGNGPMKPGNLRKCGAKSGGNER